MHVFEQGSKNRVTASGRRWLERGAVQRQLLVASFKYRAVVRHGHGVAEKLPPRA